MNGIARKDYAVVRNSSYQRNNFSLRERHNERKNEEYANPDIIQERSNLNIHYKTCDTTYTQAFDKLLTDYMNADKDIPQNVRDSAMFPCGYATSPGALQICIINGFAES